MEVKHTKRNFEIIEFKDTYKQECTLQQSSIATYEKPGTSAIWFGCGEDRMHLNREQLEELMVHLNNWLEHGTFKLQTGGVK